MSDFNKVILLGRIGNELELKQSAKGVPYLRMSLATDSHRAGKEKTTHWHQVMVFSTQAENCARYLRKGSQVMVEGSLEVRTYTNSEDRKVTRVSVLADRVKFLGGRMAADVSPVDESETDTVGENDSSIPAFA